MGKRVTTAISGIFFTVEDKFVKTNKNKHVKVGLIIVSLKKRQTVFL